MHVPVFLQYFITFEEKGEEKILVQMIIEIVYLSQLNPIQS